MKFKAKTLEDVALHFADMSDRNVKRFAEVGGQEGRRHMTREMIECKARAEAFAAAAQIIRDTELDGHAPATPRKRRAAEPPVSKDAQ
jgi:hypothetical protein